MSVLGADFFFFLGFAALTGKLSLPPFDWSTVVKLIWFAGYFLLASWVMILALLAVISLF